MLSKAMLDMIDCVTPKDDRAPINMGKAKSLEPEIKSVVPPPAPTRSQVKMRLVVGENTTRMIALRAVRNAAGPISQSEIVEAVRRAGKTGIHMQKQVGTTMRELEADGLVVQAPSPSWDLRSIWWMIP